MFHPKAKYRKRKKKTWDKTVLKMWSQKKNHNFALNVLGFKKKLLKIIKNSFKNYFLRVLLRQNYNIFFFKNLRLFFQNSFVPRFIYVFCT